MEGIEPTTHGLQNRCSGQLSYIGNLMFRLKSRELLVHYKPRGFLLDKNLYLQELRGAYGTRTRELHSDSVEW